MAKKFSSGHPKPHKPKKPGKPGRPLGAPQKVGGVYRRKGSAYDWRPGKHGFTRVPGSARGGPGARPYDPLQPLQGRAFNQEVSRNVNLKYGPQLGQVGQMQANAPTWYDQYRQQLAQQTAATQGAYNQAQQNVYNQANTASAQDTAQASKLQQESQASAQMRGAQVDPQLAQQAAQAAAARTALSSSFGGMIGAQGAAQYAYGGAQQNAATGSKIGALERLAQQKQGLLSERGDYASQVRGDLRDKERTYALNRSAFGLNVQKQRDTAADQRRRAANVRRGQRLISKDKRRSRRLESQRIENQRMESDRTFQLNKQKYGDAHAKDQYQRKHGLGPYKPGGGGKNKTGSLTPSKRLGYRDKWRGYVGNIRTGQKPPKGVDPLLGGAAKEYEQNRKSTGKGFVSHGTRQKIRKNFGFWVPGPPKTSKKFKKTVKKNFPGLYG